MTRHCPLCDRPLPSSSKVKAQVSDTSGAIVHKTCAELSEYEYEDWSEDLPPVEEQIENLIGSVQAGKQHLFDISIHAEKIDGRWVYTAKDPHKERSQLFGETLQELYDELAYCSDWAIRSNE